MSDQMRTSAYLLRTVLVIGPLLVLSLWEPVLQNALAAAAVCTAALVALYLARDLRSVTAVAPGLLLLCVYAATSYLKSGMSFWGLTGSYIDETSVLALAAAGAAVIAGEYLGIRTDGGRVIRVVRAACLVWGGVFFLAAIAGWQTLGERILWDPGTGFVFIAGFFSAVVLWREGGHMSRMASGAAMAVSLGMIAVTILPGSVPPVSGILSDRATPVPSLSETFEIATVVWAQGSHAALLGVGPKRFADAWHLYRSWEANATSLWNQEPQTGSGFVPTIAIEYGLVGLWSFAAVFLLVLGMLLRGTHRPIVLIHSCAVICVLVFFMPSTLALICIGLAAGYLVSSLPRRHPSRSADLAAAALIAAACLFTAWFCVSILVATVNIRWTTWDDLDPTEFDRRVRMLSVIPAPFATIYEMEVAQRRLYVGARIMTGQTTVISRDDLAVDQLFQLSEAMRRVGESRSGMRSALAEAQLALWGAEMGRDVYLGPARLRLTPLIDERAPMHIVGRLLLAEMRAAHGEDALSEYQRRFVRLLRPDIDETVRGTGQ